MNKPNQNIGYDEFLQHLTVPQNGVEKDIEGKSTRSTLAKFLLAAIPLSLIIVNSGVVGDFTAKVKEVSDHYKTIAIEQRKQKALDENGKLPRIGTIISKKTKEGCHPINKAGDCFPPRVVMAERLKKSGSESYILQIRKSQKHASAVFQIRDAADNGVYSCDGKKKYKDLRTIWCSLAYKSKQHTAPHSKNAKSAVLHKEWKKHTPPRDTLVKIPHAYLELSSLIKEATKAYGLPKSHIPRLLYAEAGKDIRKGNFNARTSVRKKDGTLGSSAVGIGQFIDETWLITVKDPEFQQKTGIPVKSMNGKQLFDLRNNPNNPKTLKAQVHAIGLFTKNNKEAIEPRIGRKLEGDELYSAHFFGDNKEVYFLEKVKSSPHKLAAFDPEMQAATRANPSVFFKKDGKARSFVEVKAEIKRRYLQMPTSFTVAGYTP